MGLHSALAEQSEPNETLPWFPLRLLKVRLRVWPVRRSISRNADAYKLSMSKVCDFRRKKPAHGRNASNEKNHSDPFCLAHSTRRSAATVAALLAFLLPADLPRPHSSRTRSPATPYRCLVVLLSSMFAMGLWICSPSVIRPLGGYECEFGPTPDDALAGFTEL